MTLAIKDGAGTLTNLASDELVAGTHTPRHSLVGDAQTDLAAIKVSVAATATSLAAQAAYLDGLEGYLDTVEAKLQSIADAQAVPSGGAIIGYVGGIGTGADVAFATKTTVRGIVITNLDATNNLLVKKGATPTTTDVDTYTVKPGLNTPFLPCTDPSVFKMRSSAGTIVACYAGA